MWAFGGGGFRGGGFYGGRSMFGFGYGPPAPRPLGYYSDWYGFHDSWIGYMDWMDHHDYLIWHEWQLMLSTMTIGVVDQRSMLLGMLQQGHGNMSRQEIEALTDRMLQMNRELGAGENGRVEEVTETTTTTTTTTTSNVSMDQRYQTANDFLQLLNTSGGMGCSIEQAQQTAEDIRQGKRDDFVRTHIESKTVQSSSSQPSQQQAIQAPPPQQQVPTPQPIPTPMQLPPRQQQVPTLQPIPTPMQQPVQVSYPPQQQQQQPTSTLAQFQPQQSLQVPPAQQQIQGGSSIYQQSISNQAQLQPQPNTQMPPPQQQIQGGSSIYQQTYAQSPHQSNTSMNNSGLATTSTTTTTTSEITTPGMQGMAVTSPYHPQIKTPMFQQQSFSHHQLGAPQQQSQLTYPGYGTQQPQQITNFNQQAPTQQASPMANLAPQQPAQRQHGQTSPQPIPHQQMMQQQPQMAPQQQISQKQGMPPQPNYHSVMAAQQYGQMAPGQPQGQGSQKSAGKDGGKKRSSVWGKGKQ